MTRSRTPAPPLDAAATERLALRYVERYATTRAKLSAYLARKLRERGTGDPAPDIVALVERIADLGYVDDRAFAEMRAGAMARRGLGGRRVAMTLHHAGVDAADCEPMMAAAKDQALETALVFARRKSIGPFAQAIPDRAQRERQIVAMLRAGHGFDIAKRVVDTAPGCDIMASDGG